MITQTGRNNARHSRRKKAWIDQIDEIFHEIAPESVLCEEDSSLTNDQNDLSIKTLIDWNQVLHMKMFNYRNEIIIKPLHY